MTLLELASSQLRELAAENAILFPWSVDQYHSMINAGYLPEGEPFELLNGQLVRKDRSAAGEDRMTVGHEHAWVVGELTDLGAKLKRLGCFMRIQMPLTLPPFDEPEPDGAIAIGSNRDYRNHHPGALEVTCAIEVADSSLRRDRTTKLRIYAASGIPVYVIINLLDRVVEVRTQPVTSKGGVARYKRVETLRSGQRLMLPAANGKSLAVAVRRLLP